MLNDAYFIFLYPLDVSIYTSGLIPQVLRGK